MREILFRGKTKVHKKWVYGWYCGKILSEDMSSTEESSQIIDDKTLYWHTCEAETIGQFTGMTDKNGKRIFEGDIVTYCWEDGKFVKFKIEFVQGEFLAVPVKQRKDVWAIRISGQDEELEVIGNIHDTLELLED